MRKEFGSATVELAIVGALFFWLLLAVIEVGRLMYTMNALNEVTRLGARAASVCEIQDTDIAKIATFNNGGLLQNLDSSNISINYLDQNGGVVANPNPAIEAAYLQIRFVRVSISGFNYQLLIPGIGNITLPTFSTTLPRESLGIVPNEAAGRLRERSAAVPCGNPLSGNCSVEGTPAAGRAPPSGRAVSLPR